MPKKYDRCVRDVSKKIKTGKIRKTYVKGGKRYKSNPYAICSRLRASKKNDSLVMAVTQPFKVLKQGCCFKKKR